jgi:hypothetical protein
MSCPGTTRRRYDLQDATADAVEEEYLAFNADRGHKDMLARARIAMRRLEIEKNRPRGGLGMYEQAEARDRIAKLFKLGSGRTASRYWRVLKTPQEVQDAFRTGALSLIVAEKVADLSAVNQKEIAQRILSGETPKDVVDSHTATSKSHKRHAKPENALVAFARSIEVAHLDLSDRVDSVPSGHIHHWLRTLRRGRKLIRTLIAQQESYVETPSVRGLPPKTGS